MARILIVEDSTDNMKLFRTILGLRGHETLPLAGGEQLLGTLAAGDPDLVLMDLQLPERDGYALLDEIRRHDRAGRRVVALTAHAMAGDRERALAAGFDGYITKPIDIRRFPDQIARALAGETVSD
jgi:two-component system cell cycle response regulator DivK